MVASRGVRLHIVITTRTSNNNIKHNNNSENDNNRENNNNSDNNNKKCNKIKLLSKPSQESLVKFVRLD